MQSAINRVMQAYTMIANLTPEQAQATRERLTAYLAGMDADEKALAVEGMRYLRGPDRDAKRRIMLSVMADSLTKRDQPDRSKINMNEDDEVHYWTKHLNISKEELQKAIDKVGNSAAAVRKELAVD